MKHLILAATLALSMGAMMSGTAAQAVPLPANTDALKSTAAANPTVEKANWWGWRRHHRHHRWWIYRRWDRW